MKLQNEDVPHKADLIGSDEHISSRVGRGAFSFSALNQSLASAMSSAAAPSSSGQVGGSAKQKTKTSAFSLTGRDAILHAGVLDGPVIIPHAAAAAAVAAAGSPSGDVPIGGAATPLKYPYEALFRSVQWAIVDNATREFFFLQDFFLVSGRPLTELFNVIWGKTFLTLLKTIEEHVVTSYDAIGLLLCLQVRSLPI